MKNNFTTNFRYALIFAVLTLTALVMGIPTGVGAGVIREGERIFLQDRTGERWDITQAVSIGFDPHGFQFGIGRHAIRPLDGSGLERDAANLDSDVRVLGVENREEAHAYVIRKLTRHEIANTRLGETPIAAAY